VKGNPGRIDSLLINYINFEIVGVACASETFKNGGKKLGALFELQKALFAYIL